jgi:ornithine cyclodeaminase/alanine dehydrogenase-like protein (mu-crystallin family)
MLVLSAAQVAALLDLDRLVDALAAAMDDFSHGRTSMPPRVAAMVDDRDAMLAVMPAFLPSANALTTKLVSLFPQNTAVPTHQAVICCFDPETGTPLALLDGEYITAARTAAGSALATRLLARPDAAVVSIIGTGVQARSHAYALSRLPGIAVIQVTGRDPSRAAALADELHGAGIPASAAASVEDAVRTADVVCAATHSAEPVFNRAWLRPGAHVNSVGYNSSGSGEVDLQTLVESRLVVESRASALSPPPSGPIELHHAIGSGAVTADHIYAELGELVAGDKPGRTDDEQLTLYKSVGVAVQDAAAAALVLANARARGVGTEVDF